LFGLSTLTQGRLQFALATEPGNQWPGSEPAASVPTDRTYAFVGAIAWWGHGGALDVELRDPQVHLAVSGRSTVSVAIKNTGDRSAIAAFTEWKVVGPNILIPLPRLTWAGVSLLGDVYQVGDALDPMEVGPLADPRACPADEPIT